MTTSSSHKPRGGASPSLTTILVVDDEKIIRELCAHVLQEYRVILASTSEEALRLYGKEHIDLIISDIIMPGGSGLDLLKQVKALDPNAAVIIMTGFVDKEVILSALKENADDFVNKPLNLNQLKTSVERVLEKKALKDELADLKRSELMKSAFLSMVSHKFRTPITGLSLFLQSLESGVLSDSAPGFKQHVAIASEEARYLGRLVTDLLAFSQVMGNGSIVRKKTCNLQDIISNVLIKCRESLYDMDVEVDLGPSEALTAQLDEDKIAFALLQVIDNAFKFSGRQGHVSIKFGTHTETAYIVISDSGIGIPQSELSKVFEKFYQIDPDNTGQIRGFGLGLFYARDFIRQHGGSIDLFSEPGLGTTVTITLPLQ